MLRDATPDDIAAIAAIHVESTHRHYAGIVPADILAGVTLASRTATWQGWFAAGGQRVLVLEEDGVVSGFTRLCPARDVADPPAGWGEISHLYVDPTRIGSGRGHQLFAAGVEALRAAGHAGVLLWTLEENRLARAFYARHGMAPDGATYEDDQWHGPGVIEVRYRLPFAGGA